jgi:hypothetical protein
MVDASIAAHAGAGCRNPVTRIGTGCGLGSADFPEMTYG